LAARLDILRRREGGKRRSRPRAARPQCAPLPGMDCAPPAEAASPDAGQAPRPPRAGRRRGVNAQQYACRRGAGRARRARAPRRVVSRSSGAAARRTCTPPLPAPSAFGSWKALRSPAKGPPERGATRENRRLHFDAACRWWCSGARRARPRCARADNSRRAARRRPQLRASEPACDREPVGLCVRYQSRQAG